MNIFQSIILTVLPERATEICLSDVNLGAMCQIENQEHSPVCNRIELLHKNSLHAFGRNTFCPTKCSFTLSECVLSNQKRSLLSEPHPKY